MREETVEPGRGVAQLHERLAELEACSSSRPAIVTGVQSVRIMRLIALMSGEPCRCDGAPADVRRR
jgi:hypothetical protein